MGKLSEIVEVSISDAHQQILDELTSLDLPAELDQEDGSFISMVARVGAYIRAAGTREAVALKSCTIGELLEGDALDLWSKSVYGHVRGGETTAVWKMTVSSLSSADSYTISEGSMVASNGLLTFRATHDTTRFPSVASLPALPLTLTPGSSVEVAFYCERGGADGSGVAIGSINRLITTFAGVSVTNSQLLEAGVERESDKQLKQRNSTWWTTLNKLTLVKDAYIYYARNADSRIKRVALDSTNPRGEFTLDIYVAGDSGSPGSEAIAKAQADIRGRVHPQISQWIDVKPTTTLDQELSGQAYYFSEFEYTAVQQAIRKAVADMVAEMPIQGSKYLGYGGNRVLRAQYEKAILSAEIDGVKCIDIVELSTPAVATELAVGQSITVNNISFNFGGIALFAVSR
jgi:phage-related baseplate assembly protein